MNIDRIRIWLEFGMKRFFVRCEGDLEVQQKKNAMNLDDPNIMEE